MDTYKIEVATTVEADAKLIYGVLADYHNHHPNILPKYFTGIEVEQGGVGDGTIIRVTMKVMGVTQQLRLLVSEPIPGRVLQEEDPAVGVTTHFIVEPVSGESTCHVTIQTEWKQKKGLAGLVEKWVNLRVARRLYAKELENLKGYCERMRG